MSGSTMGVLTKVELVKQLVKKNVTVSDPVSLIVSKELRIVSSNIPLNELARILNRTGFALVDDYMFVTTSDIIRKFTHEIQHNESMKIQKSKTK